MAPNIGWLHALTVAASTRVATPYVGRLLSRVSVNLTNSAVATGEIYNSTEGDK